MIQWFFMLSLLKGDHRQLANLMFQKRIINYYLFLKQESTNTILVPAETLSLPPMLLIKIWLPALSCRNHPCGKTLTDKNVGRTPSHEVSIPTIQNHQLPILRDNITWHPRELNSKPKGLDMSRLVDRRSNSSL